MQPLHNPSTPNQRSQLVGGSVPMRSPCQALCPESRVALQVVRILDAAVRLGMGTLRMWAFADGEVWNAVQPDSGELDERILKCGPASRS